MIRCMASDIILSPRMSAAIPGGFSFKEPLHEIPVSPGAGAGPLAARLFAGGLLLLLREKRRHLATGPKSVHHLRSERKNRDLHRAAEIRRQRPRLRHGDPDADATEAQRDAARF